MPIYPTVWGVALPDAIRANGMEPPPITVIDVGCSGGIGSIWTPLAGIVHGHGIDPAVAEIARLTASETRPRMTYYEGWAGPDKPIRPKGAWFRRTSNWIAHQNLKRVFIEHHLNPDTPLVLSKRRFTLDALTRKHRIAPDFIKTDTDVFDFAVLQGAKRSLKSCLGVLVEASFCDETGHATFRDIDRFLAKRGFVLAGMHINNYTRASLPGQFRQTQMADTLTGGSSWADVLYLRDPATIGSLDQALKFAMICELFNMPDIGAETLLRFRDQTEPLLDVLVRYSGRPDLPSYRAMEEAFLTDPQSFVVPDAIPYTAAI